DILLCIQTGKTVKDEKRLHFNTDQIYFKSPLEMKETFIEIPEAIANTIVIAERCNLDFSLGRSLLPYYEVPEGYTPDSFLHEIALNGLKDKFTEKPPLHYFERIKMELEVIKRTGYSSYFLIVWDFISYAKKKGIPVGPGRGSAAGSLVAYCLGVTEIDPIKYNLLFERFLNPERVSMPDIDVDFCKDRRSEVISYVSEKYGKDHVAQIITFGTMASKAAIRDVGRVLDIPYAEVDRIAKLVPSGPDIKSIDDAIKVEPQLKELYDADPVVKELLSIAKRLEGLSRHASTHAAGVVIAPEPLTNFTALYKNPSEDTITTQFDMGSIEKVGLLKFDFLGLKTLTVLEKTMQFIKQQGKEIVLSGIPLDDESTYKLLNSGETTGIFQLESSGMRDVLLRMQPSRFEDLIALVALYRPGPMAWIDDFIKGKKNRAEIRYELPQLKEILDETYGIILYQEQVMMIANKIASFSMGQADLLRKAMGKKIPEEMEKQKESFIKGAIKNGVLEEKAKELFKKMEPFAQYGFNKSHSAAYAYLAYQTAFLKAHFPVEFMTANLSADMGDTDKCVKLIAECKNMSITILPPDINESEREFRIVGTFVRFGLEAVKGVGSSAIDVIINERRNGLFRSFNDFLSRIDGKKVNKKVVESLIKAGAFDSLFEESPAVARAKAMKTFGSPLQSGEKGLHLFEDHSPAEIAQFWDEKTLLIHEKEALGFYLSGHPLSRYRKRLATLGVEPILNIETGGDREDIGIAGVVSGVKSRAREKGITSYLILEDETGTCEVLVFSDAYKKYLELLKKGNVLLVKGQIAKAEKGTKVIAREIQDLSNMEIAMRYEIALKCEELNNDKLQSLRELMDSPSKCQDVSLTFKFISTDYSVVIATRLQPSNRFLSEVEKMTGGALRVL
ncbi:MAG: DNA polymerase III subunit alpha, partial [Dissulfurispiraceae bacterium]